MESPLPVGISLMLEEDFLGATLPLFEEGAVDVLEWSFDVGWGRELPAWAQGLLQHFAVSGRLLGHGVSFSPLSARWEEPQRNWLHRAALEVAKLKYRHVSEHFGFMAAGSFTRGSPMPMPADAAVIRTGRDALSRLAEVTGLPVGLENLALALSSRDVDGQGDHLDALLEPVGGFVVLDLHNLWCQAVNFGRDPVGLLGRYPLSRGITLVLLKIDARVLLVSQSVSRSGASMQTLCEIDEPDQVASILLKASRNERSSIADRFQSLLSSSDRAMEKELESAGRQVFRTSSGDTVELASISTPVPLARINAGDAAARRERNEGAPNRLSQPIQPPVQGRPDRREGNPAPVRGYSVAGASRPLTGAEQLRRRLDAWRDQEERAS
ncbi:MAG: DUF692 family protein [Phycisphaerales bacterium]|nr:DUF692 family protein [Phycisphaerales bacterium]